MKKCIALFLCLVMLVSICLSGCGFEKKKLVGTWETIVDLAPMVNDEMKKSDPTIAEFVHVPYLNVTFYLTFNEDDTYSMTVDQEKLDEALQEMMEGMVDGLMRYLEEMLVVEDLGMSLDQVLEMLNLDLDAMLADAYDAMVAEDIFADLETHGYYKAEKGKLYTAESQQELELGIAPFEYYTLKDGVLTITEGTAENEMAEYLYPMYFQKAD